MQVKIEFSKTIEQLVSEIGVIKTAKEIGVTKDAVRQMISNERQIYLKKLRGRWHYAEFKDFKRGKS